MQQGDVSGGQEAAEQRGRRGTAWLVAALGLVVLLGLTLLVSRLAELRPRLTGEAASAIITAQLQREARQAFVVTGSLDLAVTTRVRNVRRLLPGLLNASLGAVESTVRAPGRVSYGFDLAAVHAADIEVHGDTIRMRVPEVRVYSVEPRLQDMEVETTAGWLRLAEGTQRQVQQRATALLLPALRRQAERYLEDSEQPRINTAETLSELLRPPLVAAGMKAPVFEFLISEQLIRRGRGGEPARGRRP